jgi:apolipoprotein N-acyltransferase
MFRLKLWLAIPVAVLAGFVLQGAFPALGLWPLSFLGVFLMLWSILGRTFWMSVLLGFIAGTIFWLTLINWLTLYLGPVPWLALGLLQAIFFGFGIGLISLVLNRGALRWPTRWGRIGLVSIVVAGLWVVRESVTSVWPYGGFSWGRIAQSQSQSLYSHDVAWVGTAGLSFLVVLVTTLVFQIFRERKLILLTIPAVVLVVMIVFPAFSISETGYTRILAVQGNSKAGLFDEHEPGEIFQDHVSGTLPFAGEEIDMVVWPENGTDISPADSSVIAKTLTAVSDRMKAPIVTGVITTNTHQEFFNSSIVWTDSIQGQYDKIHPVPFAEYMPNRSLWRTFQPELVDLVTRDYSFGTRPNVLEIGGIPVGISICFDITDDQQSYEMIAGGAQVILAQTNNADFGKTSENVQQLAIARLRATETGRSVVNISTVGTSAIISPTGETLDNIPAYEPGAMLDTVPLSTTITPAMAAGRLIEWILCVIGLTGLVLCLLPRRP